MSTVEGNAIPLTETDDNLIGGFVIGLVFIGITAGIFSLIYRMSDMSADATIKNIISQVLLAVAALFIIALLANYKAMDIMQDHAYQILVFSYLFGISIFAGGFILSGVSIMISSGGSIMGMFVSGLGVLILFFVYMTWERMKNKLFLAAEWMKVATTIVLNEPGMLLLSFIQSVVIGIGVITQFILIYVWGIYVSHGNISERISSSVVWLIIFLYYWFTAFVVYYFDGANTFISYQRIKGVDPKVGHGISASTKNIGSIAVFSLITGTIGFLKFFARTKIETSRSSLNSGSSEDDISAALLKFVFMVIIYFFMVILEWIYYYISFFTLPIIIIRKKKALEAMSESKEYFMQRPWEILVSDMGFNWGMNTMYFIIGLILAVCGFAYGYMVIGIVNGLPPITWGIIMGLVSLIFGVLITKFFIKPLYTAFITTIYVYASEGVQGMVIVPDNLKNKIMTMSQYQNFSVNNRRRPRPW